MSSDEDGYPKPSPSKAKEQASQLWLLEAVANWKARAEKAEAEIARLKGIYEAAVQNSQKLEAIVEANVEWTALKPDTGETP